MRQMRRVLLGLAITAATLTYACDDDPADIGMSISADTGGLVIFGVLCHDTQAIVGVRLVDSVSGTTLWGIRSDVGSRNLVFAVGHVPSDFVATVTPQPLPSGDPLLRGEIDISRKSGDDFTVREEYKLSRVKPGFVLAHAELVEAENWPEFVKKSCRS
jgi:hypothetical protein